MKDSFISRKAAALFAALFFVFFIVVLMFSSCKYEPVRYEVVVKWDTNLESITVIPETWFRYSGYKMQASDFPGNFSDPAGVKTFAGWYTAKTGGEKVDVGYVLPYGIFEFIIYAQWKD